MGLLLVLAAAVQAPVTPPVSPPDMDCQNFRDGSTVAMTECFAAQSKEWDLRLNQEYRAALSRAEIEPDKLRKSQRLWLRYRDANCSAYYSVEGTISKILAGRCWRDMTRDRALELHEMSWTG